MFTTKPTFDPGTGDGLVEAERLPSGTEFGSYRIGSAIGAGAMGTVYRAEHIVLGKQVALKLMAPALRTDTEARQRFLLEAKTTAAIKHRHVIEIVDFGECGSNPYIVMDLLDGEDLDRYLQTRTRLSSEEAVRLLLPIVAALASAHDAGVVHRDLKPSNIFLHHEPDGELVPKLLDFGISKQTRSPSRGDFHGTSWNQLLGSPHYLSPEAVNGCRDLTPRSDQYSLGVVLYECVTGRAPIERETLFELLTAIARGEFAPPSHGLPDVPGAMESAILRCMQHDPAARFADMRELGRALLELADGRTRLLWGQAFTPESLAHATSEPPGRVSSASPTPPPRGGAAGSSGRPLLSLVAASACVLAVAGVALLAATPPAPEVDRSFRAARDAPSPASSLSTPAAPRPLTPEPVVHSPVSDEDDSGPDRGAARSLEATPNASDEGHAKSASQPPARAKRRTSSPQRPSRTAVAARVRQPTAPSGVAVGDPSLPLHVDPALGAPAPDQRGPSPLTSRDRVASGANESPILD
jgi:eukaryotic-like serine/threonine-protein kinase